MDTLSPQSVLDRRQNKDSSIIADHITRAKSPARQNSLTFDSEFDQEEIINRVPQPYRTSFSAVTTLERRDRSRSTSRSTSPAPTVSSLKSNRCRSKSPLTRKLSPKHVTYDSVVTVRRSNSYEVQTLSGEDKKEMANNSSDYQSRIREMSEMIVKEYSSPEKEDVDGLFVNDAPKKNSGAVKNGAPNGRLPMNKQRSLPKQVLTKEENDRTISYRKAISDNYSTEIKQRADNIVDERYASEPQNIGIRVERSNSVPSRDGMESNKLTPHKRTISGSISNFFRRMSPRMSRKQRKERGSKTSLSSQMSRDSETGSNQRFSRGKVRQSFLNLLKRPKSKSGSVTKEDHDHHHDDTDGGFKSDATSNRILRSIEQNNMSEREVYNRFKEKQTENDRSLSDMEHNNRPQAMKAVSPTNVQIRVDSPRSAYRGVENREPVQRDREQVSRNREQKQWSPPSNNEQNSSRDQMVKRQSGPPASLNVQMVPKSGKSLQRTLMSSMSADESIGDCSLDVNFTGSDPSILSEESRDVTTPSKVVFSSTQDNFKDKSNDSKVLNSHKKDHSLSESALNPVVTPLSHNVEYTEMPKLADSAEIVLPDNSKTPSYLKLSCSVSGYGRYSQYSAYKSKKDTRSPYSSTSSLGSNPMSPEMAKVMSPVQRTSISSNSEFGLIRPQPLVYNRANRNVTNSVNSSLINGHSVLDGTQYPTGDPKLDGEYYLNVTKTEAVHLVSLCRQIEADLYCQDIPEDASGKIRAAIGKANLLVNQKFKQFEELCYEHMNPSVDGKLLKWEDLQGFWDMIKIQVDNVEEMFTELELIRQNGWKELCMHSRESSVSSSPKSGSVNLSNASTPAGTPGSRRRVSKTKETPESSPERTERLKLAKARDDARKKMMAEKRAAMKKKQQNNSDDVEIYIADK